MLKVSELKELMGLIVTPEVYETEHSEDGEQKDILVQESVDTSTGYHFYYFLENEVSGKYQIDVIKKIGGQALVFKQDKIIYVASKKVAPKTVKRVAE
jgi:hypothetical protein